ncbi:carboxyltransferase domain-containing protein [Arthrobacter nitrophenolicus]|uniref:Carboxyltransferase domain-containing protein n=1 Tax=Arthrobacter nitrophenolicus TaxID=683150 RepID=A0A4V3B299_9MICC|nr:carboxyltransferase domain-containing protein [Arthrobacter nitrophenolicus]TDL39658.1 carboxyltransferase domain-containing protein [Arthrobacter nitrophenolicus]
MRFSPTFTVIRSGTTQTMAIVGDVDALSVRRKVFALQRAMESYGLTGVDKVSTIGRTLLVDYDPFQWSHASMRSALVALESTISRPGETQPLKHFEWTLYAGEEENDLQLAASAHGITPESFLARVTRRTYLVQDFRMPSMSLELFRRNSPRLKAAQLPQEKARLVSCGTVTLSSDGLCVYNAESLTRDLVIGRIKAECVAPDSASFRVGDRIRFRRQSEASNQ